MSWLVKMEISSQIALRLKILDSYDWHQKLWECYPGMPDKNRGFLTRLDALEGAFRIWMLTVELPACPDWCQPAAFQIKEIASTFFSHRYYVFDLMANPVKTLVVRGSNGETLYGKNGKRHHGKRVPIVNNEDLADWVKRKGMVRSKDQQTGSNIPGGFRIVEERPLEIRRMTENYFTKTDKNAGITHRAFHGSVQFRGTLEVTDHIHFQETFHKGIGSAKGFGQGLMLLSPVKL